MASVPERSVPKDGAADGDGADDEEAALRDVNVLDGHLLLAARAVALESFHLRRIGPRQLR
jgi:hypothetical protein